MNDDPKSSEASDHLGMSKGRPLERYEIAMPTGNLSSLKHDNHDEDVPPSAPLRPTTAAPNQACDQPLVTDERGGSLITPTRNRLRVCRFETEGRTGTVRRGKTAGVSGQGSSAPRLLISVEDDEKSSGGGRVVCAA